MEPSGVYGPLFPDIISEKHQEITNRLNLTVLKRGDRFIQEILFTANVVFVYQFDWDLGKWSRMDVEGALFVVKRTAQPKFQFVVMNRLNPENLVEDLNGDFEYEVQNESLSYSNASADVRSLWFLNQDELKTIDELFSCILDEGPKVVPPKPKCSSSKRSSPKRPNSHQAKAADIFLWRDKKISAGVLGGVTAIWVLFELLDYHLLTLVCHSLILTLAILFLWSNATTFINKSPPHIPVVSISEDLAVQIALSLRYYINRGFAALREIASGRDLKKFLAVIAGLWLLSTIGSCFNFLSLFYIGFLSLHTIPLLYEKYEDHVDSFAEKATAEAKKHYGVVHANYLSKIPAAATLKGKKLL